MYGRPLLFFLFGVSLVFSISAVYILGGILFVGAAAQLIRTRQWKRTVLDIPLGIYFFGGIILSLIHGSTPFLKSITTQSAFLLYFVITNHTNRTDLKNMMWGFGLGSVVAGTWGALQSLSGVIFEPNSQTYTVPDALKNWPAWITENLATYNGRARGARSHPLTYAESLIPGFFLLLIICVNACKDKKAPMTIIKPLLGFLLITAGVVATQGRGVWLGLAVGIVFFIFLLPQPMKVRLITLGCLAGLGLSVMIFSPSLRQRALSIVHPSYGSYGDKASRGVRWAIWTETLKQIKDHPMGVGVRGVRLKVDGHFYAQDRIWKETHNMYFQNLLERGFIGFGILLWILFIIVMLASKSPPHWRPFFVATISAFLVAGLTESWMKDKEIAFIFWTMIAALSALLKKTGPPHSLKA